MDYEILWIPEVSIGVGGSIDYVAIKRRKRPHVGDIEDFVCVEFQAAGTTGTPWDAVLEHKETGRFSKDRYKYGINWANEFAKTMMQQVYKKGKIIEFWGSKIIFVLQDVGLAYLRKAYDTTGLREGIAADPISFYTFKMSWNEVNTGGMFCSIVKSAQTLMGSAEFLEERRRPSTPQLTNSCKKFGGSCLTSKFSSVRLAVFSSLFEYTSDLCRYPPLVYQTGQLRVGHSPSP